MVCMWMWYILGGGGIKALVRKPVSDKGWAGGKNNPKTSAQRMNSKTKSKHEITEKHHISVPVSSTRPTCSLVPTAACQQERATEHA